MTDNCLSSIGSGPEKLSDSVRLSVCPSRFQTQTRTPARTHITRGARTAVRCNASTWNLNLPMCALLSLQLSSIRATNDVAAQRPSQTHFRLQPCAACCCIATTARQQLIELDADDIVYDTLLTRYDSMGTGLRHRLLAMSLTSTWNQVARRCARGRAARNRSAETAWLHSRCYVQYGNAR